MKGIALAPGGYDPRFNHEFPCSPSPYVFHPDLREIGPVRDTHSIDCPCGGRWHFLGGHEAARLVYVCPSCKWWHYVHFVGPAGAEEEMAWYEAEVDASRELFGGLRDQASRLLARIWEAAK